MGVPMRKGWLLFVEFAVGLGSHLRSAEVPRFPPAMVRSNAEPGTRPYLGNLPASAPTRGGEYTSLMIARAARALAPVAPMVATEFGHRG